MDAQVENQTEIEIQSAPKQRKGRGGARPGAGRPKGEWPVIKRRLNTIKHNLRDLASAHVPGAIAQLAHIANNSKSDQARVAAIKEILDRAHGKAPQKIEGDPDNPLIPARIEVVLVDPNAQD